MATVYFSGSISGGRQDVGLYRRIVEALDAAGHDVLAGAVASEDIGDSGEALSERDIFERDLRWVDQAAAAGGVLVAEVSRPSTGVGYEIAYARYYHRMRVICLYRPAWTSRCTAMISGDEGLELISYTDESLGDMLAKLESKLVE